MPGESQAAPRRTTRRTAKGQATRERIVTAAANLMYTRGVERTTLDDVIEASDTGKSQLYHYFAHKDELVEAVVDAQINQVMAQQEPYLDELDSLEGLQRWRDAVIANARTRHGAYGCPLGSLSSELADHSDAARRQVQKGFSAWESALRTGLRRMRDSGELAPDADPARLATGLVAALQGGYVLAQAARDVASLEVAVDMALAHIRSLTRPLPR